MCRICPRVRGIRLALKNSAFAVEADGDHPIREYKIVEGKSLKINFAHFYGNSFFNELNSVLCGQNYLLSFHRSSFS